MKLWALCVGLACAALVRGVAPVHAQVSTGAWQPGPNATGDNTLVGFVDTPANGSSVPANRLISVNGWTVDRTAEGWSGIDAVQIFLGTMDSGTLVGRGTMGQNRPDVAATMGNPFWASAGWSATVDTGALSPGTDKLFVYAHTPARGWWYVQHTLSLGAPSPLAGPPPTVTVSAPLPNENVSVRLDTYTITGVATDPVKGPRGVDWVELWFNGEENTENATFMGTVTPDESGAWSLPFSPEAHIPIPSNIYVYVHSSVTGKRGLTVVHFNLVDRPL